MTLAAAAAAAKIKFDGSDLFQKTLKARIDRYFRFTRRSPRDCWQMYLKTAIIMSWAIASYLLLIFATQHWWQAIPLAVSLGMAMAAIGFNIQHDGGHRAYSDRPWVNKLMSMSLDLIGGSSYLWDWKHNSIHHTYTNIDGHDDDIAVGPLARLAPNQKWLPFHRFQNIYLWALYGGLAVKWHLFDDFYNVAIGKIGAHKIARPKGKDLLVFIAGKIAFFSIAFGVPMLLHPWWGVIAVYVTAACTSGVVLAVVFQLAHCVEEAEFPMPTFPAAAHSALPSAATGVLAAADAGELGIAGAGADQGPGRIATEWAVHQVQTTVDFARR